MLKNNLKITWRTLVTNKVFSFINIGGLAAGLAVAMLIGLWVYDELSYDKYPEKAEQIYRVQVSATGNGGVETYPNVDIAVGEGIKNAYPEIESFTRLQRLRETFVKTGDKGFKETRLASVDTNFLKVFSIPIIKGNPKTALLEPGSIVVTSAFATKYFGNEDPINKQLAIGINTYKVTGVINKVPDNSHFHFDAFIGLFTSSNPSQTWSNVGFTTYLVLNKTADPKKLEARFPELVKKYVVPEVVHDMGVSMAEAQKSVNTFRFSLMPITKIHLYSDTKYELEANGDIHYVYIFGALAIFILLLACVNFTNLSTASASRRAKEVGVRKVMGSVKNQLISQFLTESVLFSVIAMLLAFIIVFALLPYFSQLSGKNIGFDFFLAPKAIIAALLLCLLVGLLAGIYPAFFLSSFNIISVLKGTSSAGGSRKSILRSGLVVFQFFVSTALIIATIVVYQQLHFMQEKKLGYNKEQVLYLQDAYVLGNRDIQGALKQTLLKDSRVVNVSVGTGVPGSAGMDGTQIYPKDKESSENDAEMHANIYHVDYDYISALGIQVVQGRNFSTDFPTDSSGVVINETAVRDLGWGGTNPIGKTIVTSGQHAYNVIGVVADFHYASVKQKIAPLMILLGGTYRTGLIVKIKTAGVQDLLANIKKTWDSFSPGAPFSYYFLDDQFASLYANEEKTGKIFTSFALIAIIISSLGLFGLVAFITEQRTREIGIRKVLGASIRQILLLVSKEFFFLVGLAFLIAIPVTWWVMTKWLQDYSYRIHISWWMFVIAGAGAFLVTLFTVSYQAIKAAVANPVKSLRTE